MDIQQSLTTNLRGFSKFILVADIGASNTRFGVCGIKNKVPELLFNFSFPTKWIHFYEKVNQVLEIIKTRYGLDMVDLVVGAAGTVDNNVIRLTNIRRVIDAEEIISKTSVKTVLLLNDFVAAGFGINSFDKTSGTKLILGPGTGLGKAVLVWQNDMFVPLPSEGGHSDLVFEDDEKRLIKFIKRKRKKSSLVWEDVLSGRGLEDINEFITKKKKKAKLVNSPKSFKLFSKILGRCCRNFALDVLCSKIYIVGGVAMKHPDILSQNFYSEFVKGPFSHYLSTVKVEIIHDDSLGLKGCAYAFLKK